MSSSDLQASFQAALCKRVDAELKASPELQERKASMSKWQTFLLFAASPLFLACIITLVIIAPIMVLTVLPFAVNLPTSVALFSYFDSIRLDPNLGDLRVPQPGFSALASHSAVLMALLCCMIGGDAKFVFANVTKFRPQLHLPFADRSLLIQSLRSSNWIAVFVPYCLFLLYGIVAWQEEVVVGQALQIGVLALLQLWHVFALLVVGSALIPRDRGLRVFLVLSGLAVFVTACVAAVSASEGHTAFLTVFFVLPTGWINAIYYYGVLHGQLWTLALLIPVGLTSGHCGSVAATRLRSHGDWVVACSMHTNGVLDSVRSRLEWADSGLCGRSHYSGWQSAAGASLLRPEHGFPQSNSAHAKQDQTIVGLMYDGPGGRSSC